MRLPVLLILLFCPAAALPASAQVNPPGQVPLTRFLESIERRQPDFNLLGDRLAQTFREHRAAYEQDILQLGPLNSVTFRNVTVGRWYIYDAAFEQGHIIGRVGNVSDDGRIGGLYFVTVSGRVRENRREYSCVGPGTVTGRMIWPAVISVARFECWVGNSVGGSIFGDNNFGGNGPRFGPEADLVVPINIQFRNPADAQLVRLGAKATVSGHFFMVDEAHEGGTSLEVRDAAIQQAPPSEDISLPFHVYPDAVPPPPPPVPPPPADSRTEAALRHLLETIAAGKSGASALTTDQAEQLQHVRTGLQAYLRGAGTIKAMTLLAKDGDGALIYAVVFEHGSNQFSLRLGPGGLIDTLSYGPHLAVPSPATTDARQAQP